jgi:hypothetical protein
MSTIKQEVTESLVFVLTAGNYSMYLHIILQSHKSHFINVQFNEVVLKDGATSTSSKANCTSDMLHSSL